MPQRLGICFAQLLFFAYRKTILTYLKMRPTMNKFSHQSLTSPSPNHTLALRFLLAMSRPCRAATGRLQFRVVSSKKWCNQKSIKGHIFSDGKISKDTPAKRNPTGLCAKFEFFFWADLITSPLNSFLVSSFPFLGPRHFLERFFWATPTKC